MRKAERTTMEKVIKEFDLPIEFFDKNMINILPLRLRIERIIFSNPATIVFWKDGTKTVVKCCDTDSFNYEQGVKEAIVKKVFGNNKFLWEVIHEKSNINVQTKREPFIPKSIEDEEQEYICDYGFKETSDICKEYLAKGDKGCVACKEQYLEKPNLNFDHNCFIEMD